MILSNKGEDLFFRTSEAKGAKGEEFHSNVNWKRTFADLF